MMPRFAVVVLCWIVSASVVGTIANKLSGFAVSSGIGANSPNEQRYIEILRDGGFEPKLIPLELTQV